MCCISLAAFPGNLSSGGGTSLRVATALVDETLVLFDVEVEKA